jgi:hypothetical protein
MGGIECGIREIVNGFINKKIGYLIIPYFL